MLDSALNDQKFKIQFVSKVTGINPHTIRAWEKRYDAVVPNRDGNGRRIYGQDEIDRLGLLKQLVQFGNDISDIANLKTNKLQDILDQFKPAVQEVASLESNSHGAEHVVVEESLRNLIFALNNFKLDIIAHELEKCAAKLNGRRFTLELVCPFMEEVRKLKEMNVLTEFQRDSLISVLKLELGKKLHGCGITPIFDAKILIAAPEGHLNELGIMVYAILCQHHRIGFHYLGTNMKAEVLLEIAKQFKTKIVLIGGTYSCYKHAPEKFKFYIRSLQSGKENGVKIWFGGITQPHFEDDQESLRYIKTFEELDSSLQSLV